MLSLMIVSFIAGASGAYVTFVIARVVRELGRVPEDQMYDEVWRDMVRVIEASLIDEPNDWGQTEHRLTNAKRRVSIWTANDDYGLSVATDGVMAWPEHSKEAISQVPLRPQDRKRLWLTIRARLAKEVVGKFRD